MDEKGLEDGRGKEVTYENDSEYKSQMFVKEAKVAYKVDEEIEYEKYLNLPEMTRAEFIDGRIYYLGAPTKKHQEVLKRLSTRFENYLHGKSCDVYFAPFAVKIDFEFDQSSRNTLQPDLLVVCDDEKFSKQALNGAPDLIIEILSPSNASHDRVFKYNKYLSVGVKEYWIVDPMKEKIMVNIITGSMYSTTIYAKGDVIKVSILADLSINVTDLFEGYKGKEIVEVENARLEEQMKAEAKVEAQKLETAKRMLESGISIEQVAQITGLDFEKLRKLC